MTTATAADVNQRVKVLESWLRDSVDPMSERFEALAFLQEVATQVPVVVADNAALLDRVVSLSPMGFLPPTRAVLAERLREKHCGAALLVEHEGKVAGLQQRVTALAEERDIAQAAITHAWEASAQRIRELEARVESLQKTVDTAGHLLGSGEARAAEGVLRAALRAPGATAGNHPEIPESSPPVSGAKGPAVSPAVPSYPRPLGVEGCFLRCVAEGAHVRWCPNAATTTQVDSTGLLDAHLQQRSARVEVARARHLRQVERCAVTHAHLAVLLHRHDGYGPTPTLTEWVATARRLVDGTPALAPGAGEVVWQKYGLRVSVDCNGELTVHPGAEAGPTEEFLARGLVEQLQVLEQVSAALGALWGGVSIATPKQGAAASVLHATFASLPMLPRPELVPFAQVTQAALDVRTRAATLARAAAQAAWQQAHEADEAKASDELETYEAQARALEELATAISGLEIIQPPQPSEGAKS